MKKFLSKMRHPVLRRVKSLHIMAAMDLFHMDSEYRLQIVSLNTGLSGYQFPYPDVHFSLLINLANARQNLINNTMFITSMLVNLANVDFQLYQGEFANGKAMFIVRDDFVVSGMLARRDTCASVAVCEGAEYSLPLFNDIQSFCTRDALIFLKTDMSVMLGPGMDYIHTLLSPARRWMLSQATEHMLPDDLFEELLDHPGFTARGYDRSKLLYVHQLTKAVLREGDLRILVSDSAISNLVVTGEVDFFNTKLKLTYAQRIRAVEYFRKLLGIPSAVRLRLVRAPLAADFQYHTNPTMFLSSSHSYLRLQTSGPEENLLLKINHQDMQGMYLQFFDEVWNLSEGLITAHEEIESFVSHHIQNLRLISSVLEADDDTFVDPCPKSTD